MLCLLSWSCPKLEHNFFARRVRSLLQLPVQVHSTRAMWRNCYTRDVPVTVSSHALSMRLLHSFAPFTHSSLVHCCLLSLVTSLLLSLLACYLVIAFVAPPLVLDAVVDQLTTRAHRNRSSTIRIHRCSNNQHQQCRSMQLRMILSRLDRLLSK